VEARSCWFFSTRRAGPPSAQKIARRQRSREFGAVLTVVLMGPMSRCANCRCTPPEGQRWAHRPGGYRFRSVDCLYGLHPQLEEGAAPIGVLGFIDRPEATMQGVLNVFDQTILRLQEHGE